MFNISNTIHKTSYLLKCKTSYMYFKFFKDNIFYKTLLYLNETFRLFRHLKKVQFNRGDGAEGLKKLVARQLSILRLTLFKLSVNSA